MKTFIVLLLLVVILISATTVSCVRERRMRSQFCKMLIGEVQRGGILPTDDSGKTVTLEEAGCR